MSSHKDQMLTLIKLIEKHVDDGWSISVSRRLAYKKNMESNLLLELGTYPEYLEVLNKYLEKTGTSLRYKKLKGPSFKTRVVTE